MLDTRLALALTESGLILRDCGRIAVFGASDDSDLAGLSQEQVVIIEGFKPSYDAWRARGYACDVTIDTEYDAVVLALPRSKADARAMIALASKFSRGPVVIDGQKTDGIDSVLRDVRKRVEISGPISKAHGKLFWSALLPYDSFQDWEAGPALTEGGFWTAPGVFSADAVDPASAMLAQTLPDHLGAEIADLGAGWGFLAAHILTRDDVKHVHLVEANHMALECAKRNVTDSRAIFHWADATHWSEKGLDAVVMNPPFHKGRAAEPAIGRDFIRQAARSLAPRGNLWMVANRHLPYEATLQEHFAKVTEIGGDARFKLFHASKPLRKSRARV